MPASDIFSRGDYAEFRNQSQMIARMKRAEAIAKMTPAEKAEFDQREAQAKRMDAQRRALVNAFKYTNAHALTKAKTNANIEKLRAMSLDDSNPDQWLDFYRQIYAREIVGVALGKFRFVWGTDGKPVFIAWTESSWQNFFTNPQRGRWIPSIPAMYQCPPEWETRFIGEFFAASENASKSFPATDSRHVWQYKSGGAKCKRPETSTWVKIRKGVVGAALIVAAVYLGPVVYAKISGSLTGAAGSASTGASAATQATTFQRIQAGTKTLLSYVNKARTIEAIAKGELPPPPIGIAGSSFREWALIVAKEKLKDEAIEYAMEQGQEYIAQKMTEKEERALQAEIAKMQAELLALMPAEIKSMPPQPNPELAPQIKKIQAIEEQRQADFQKLLVPSLILGAVLLGVG